MPNLIKKEAYCIAIKELNDGDHRFTLAIGEPFVTDFEVTDYVRPVIKAKIALNKIEKVLRLTVSLSGTVDVECDRCLEWFSIPVKLTDSLLVLLGGDAASFDTEDNVMVLQEADDELDLGHFLYESVQLALPLRKVHPERRGKPSCNAEMLEKMNQSNQTDAFKELDPRWAALKNLKF